LIRTVSDYKGEAGGGGVMSFRFRRVKMHTPTGMSSRMSATHSREIPTVGERLVSLNVPCPAAVRAPNQQRNNPGQPQSRTAAIVAMMPVFLLFMKFFSLDVV
jgi:hypothetical protein